MSEQPHSLTPRDLGHGLQRMIGRDPHETERAATPLELLFDLVFVVAFGQAGNAFAHAIATDHLVAGTFGFVFTMFGIVWAWINHTWFASAFDTDDWAYRLWTMVVMIGAVILALGVAPAFESLEAGNVLDNAVMVAGYVVMRVAMVALWIRAKRQDPVHAGAATTYIRVILLAQIGWVATALLDLSALAFLLCVLVLGGLEMTGPWWAERRNAETPWHAHHVAERYGLLTIIALGEGIIGTVAAVQVLVEEVGWTLDAVTLMIAGVSLTFGLWWNYFAIQSGELLSRRRDRSFGWGYSHIALYMSIAAIGAGLHVVALVLEHHAEISAFGAVLTVVVPLAVFVVGLYALYAWMVGEFDLFHLRPLAASIALMFVVVALAAGGVAVHWTLLVLALVPWTTVIAAETGGRYHQARMLADWDSEA